jgi:hypothetical protein
MNGKVARIEGLMANGWDVEDIVSDHGAVEVLLRRGASRQIIVLDADDAWDVIYGAPQAPQGTRDHPRDRTAVTVLR